MLAVHRTHHNGIWKFWDYLAPLKYTRPFRPPQLGNLIGPKHSAVRLRREVTMSARRMRSSHKLVAAAIILSLKAVATSAEPTFEESFDRRHLRAKSWNACQTILGHNAHRAVEGSPGNLAYHFGIDDDLSTRPCGCQTRAQCAHLIQMPDAEPLLYQAPVLPIVLPPGDP